MKCLLSYYRPLNYVSLCRNNVGTKSMWFRAPLERAMPANVINMVAVQNLLASFCCTFGKKTLYRTFPCLTVLESSTNSSYIAKQK